MSITKPTGKRTRKRILSPKQSREKRAAQAARAILAGRGERDKHWDRIARCFTDCGSADGATTFAHRLGLATVPAYLLDAAFPPAPEPAPEPVPEPWEAEALVAGARAFLGLDDPGESSIRDEGHPLGEPEPVPEPGAVVPEVGSESEPVDTATAPLFPEEVPA